MNGAASPRVSVIMTAFNAQPYLAEALESVLGQTLADFELLFVDDGSTDATFRIAADYAWHDNRIRLTRLTHNGGVAHAKNTALRQARAPLVAICDADDRQLPERLACQAVALTERPDRVLVGCRVRPFGEAATGPEVWLPVAPKQAPARILFQVLCGDAANMFRRDLVSRHGLSYPVGPVWEDWLFQAQALRLGAVHVLPDVLMLYRRHAAQETGRVRQAAYRDRTRHTLRQVLAEAGVRCSAGDLDLHHAISPNPFGLLTDPVYVHRYRADLTERATTWLDRLGRAVEGSGWTSRQTFEAMADGVLGRLAAALRVEETATVASVLSG